MTKLKTGDYISEESILYIVRPLSKKDKYKIVMIDNTEFEADEEEVEKIHMAFYRWDSDVESCVNSIKRLCDMITSSLISEERSRYLTDYSTKKEV